MEGLERVTVRARREVAMAQAVFELDATSAMLDAHVAPGQYCFLRTLGTDDAAPFALYSAPHEGVLEFLIGAGGDNGRLVYALRDGDELEASAPQGRGFDLPRATGRDLILVATGTGFAPIRALLVTALCERRAYGIVHLIYGVRDAQYAIADELERFRAEGVEVTLHESSASAAAERRYVQHVLADSGLDLSRAAVFVAGQPEMMKAIADGVAALGGDPDWVLSNI